MTAAVDLEEENFLQTHPLLLEGEDFDEAETEEAEEDDEDRHVSGQSVLGKRLNVVDSISNGKRLRSNEDQVIELGDEEEDDEDDDDTDSSPNRPFSKNGSKQYMSKGNRSLGQMQEGAGPSSQQNKNLQRLLDSMDRKTKSELFSDALELCGSELFQGHESWRDQLLIKACRLQPSFVSSINELAHQSGSYNTPVVLSGEEDEDDDDIDDEVEDDEVDSSHSGADHEITTQSGEEDELNLMGDNDDDLELEQNGARLGDGNFATSFAARFKKRRRSDASNISSEVRDRGDDPDDENDFETPIARFLQEHQRYTFAIVLRNTFQVESYLKSKYPYRTIQHDNLSQQVLEMHEKVCRRLVQSGLGVMLLDNDAIITEEDRSFNPQMRQYAPTDQICLLIDPYKDKNLLADEFKREKDEWAIRKGSATARLSENSYMAPNVSISPALELQLTPNIIHNALKD